MELTGVAPHVKVSSRSRNPPASCVEVVQVLVGKADISREVVQVASADLRRSTAALCQSKWSRFFDWGD